MRKRTPRGGPQGAQDTEAPRSDCVADETSKRHGVGGSGWGPCGVEPFGSETDPAPAIYCLPSAWYGRSTQTSNERLAKSEPRSDREWRFVLRRLDGAETGTARGCILPWTGEAPVCGHSPWCEASEVADLPQTLSPDRIGGLPLNARDRTDPAISGTVAAVIGGPSLPPRVLQALIRPSARGRRLPIGYRRVSRGRCYCSRYS